ncbi:hypothetical protein JTZ62_05240 [Mammaliicoccus sciuri]|uniref:hypothetical protein n=1 Tax=Mammaliicoccus sciuri TaxID=1296 RepID=UPI0019D3637F|nr:hypothetical protein [Mammaliicoccus sciuri]QSN68561.1 hypothetical protein JTZ62_05240 [Mammaliicoccus sciuri]UIU26212.1 hypothetical protein LLZ92_05255 [Mammaliicoccus sciuri]
MLDFKDEISDYELLKFYNPYFIEQKINSTNMYIEDMYDYHYPHQVGDLIEHRIYFESVHIETLALSIIEKKQSLEKYIKRSNINLEVLNIVMEKYDESERKEIYQFFQTDGEYYPKDTIQKLKRHIYKVSNLLRKERNDYREKLILSSKLERAKMYKELKGEL